MYVRVEQGVVDVGQAPSRLHAASSPGLDIRRHGSGRDISALRQAMADADPDTVEGDGGFDVVMEKVDQWEQETPASDARERIDDFRLAGSRTWRRRGGHLTNRGWRTEVAH